MVSPIEIIESFSKIMVGYLLIMEQSEIVNKSKYTDMILYNGATIVIHVFTMLIHYDQSLENIINQSCKSYICYLEYIEQLDKTNLVNNLHISDISVFVYKMILGELDRNNSIHIVEDNKIILELLSTLWTVLLSWDSIFSINARLAICNIHLTKYALVLSDIPNAKQLIDCIVIIQSKMQMNENIYFIFIDEYYKHIYRLKRNNKLCNTQTINEKILLFLEQYHLEETPTEENIATIVKKIL